MSMIGQLIGQRIFLNSFFRSVPFVNIFQDFEFVGHDYTYVYLVTNVTKGKTMILVMVMVMVLFTARVMVVMLLTS